MKGYGITVPKVTVQLGHAQIDWLNWVSGQYGASVSEIIRRLIDETRGAYLTPPDARTALQASFDEATTKPTQPG